MTKTTIGPEDLRAFDDVRDGRITRAMAPLYGQSIARLIAAGLVRLGADGVFHLTSDAVPSGAAAGPVAPVEPRPEIRSEALVLRLTPSERKRIDDRAKAEAGGNRSDLIRQALGLDPVPVKRPSRPPPK